MVGNAALRWCVKDTNRCRIVHYSREFAELHYGRTIFEGWNNE